jgi:hypothetical protein
VETVASSEEEDNAINYEVPNFRRFWWVFCITLHAFLMILIIW